ncbi:MAG: SWI/SNF chromatin-remodeling complex subunit [Thelocarpon impressellum]|nr:MAG: SWI/SNF chromatin-remodeling complex subunit [Thelocarpon impressellum]
MPSPVSTQPPSQAGSGATSRNGSQHGSVTSVEAAGGAAAVDGAAPGPDDRTRDAISEGKHKAKAVLAASGLSLNSASTTTTINKTSDKDSPSARSLRSSRSRESPMPSRPRPTMQEVLLDQYLTKDMLHASAFDAQQQANNAMIRSKRAEAEYLKGPVRRERGMNPAAVFGQGYAGYGNGHTDGKARILYPCQRKRPGNRRTRELRVPRKEMLTQADQLEELIPVRLDVDWDKIKLRDTFTWNLHDRVISPEHFAEQLVEDFRLPPESAGPLVQFVAQALSEQIQDFYPQVFIEEEALDPHLPYHAYKNDEMRVLIKLNVTIGQHTLVDQFEWEINNPLNSPEDFAKQMTRDLSLSGEFATAIAHSIREQSQLFTKSLYITGHPFDGRPIEDADLRDAFLPSPLPCVFRPAQHAKDYAPYLWELNEAELDRAETSLSREQRRQKRTMNRRGGPALPDLKDRQRTVRTLVVSSVLLGAADSIGESRMFKRPEGGQGRPGRRAAAGQKAGVDDSDLSESEDSAPESPANSSIVMTGTARTRGVRGAASAAQAAMRANLGRSTTPEPATLHHHETRTSARRFGTREESVGDGTTLMVKLKISRERFRQFERERKARARSTLAQLAANGTPTRGSMAPPPSTPGMAPLQMGGYAGGPPNGTPAPQPTQLGAVHAERPPLPGQPGPPAPTWLTSALATLHASYPSDSFEGFMRYAAVDPATGIPIPTTIQPPPPPPPGGVKHQYLPRIRCNDCPGKLYTPGPDTTVGNFEVHLRNGAHRRNVERRVAAAAEAAGA